MFIFLSDYHVDQEPLMPARASSKWPETKRHRMFIAKLNKHLGHDRMRDPHLYDVYNYMLLNTVLFCSVL